MNEEIKKQWVAALRSGEYQQGVGQLRDGDKFCCLGVLCDLHSKTGHGHWTHIGWYEINESSYTESAFDVLPESVSSWAGLSESNPYVDKDHTLATYNDGSDGHSIQPHSFLEIADLIEQHL